MLETACIAVTKAKNANGLCVMLCNALDPIDVQAAFRSLAAKLESGSMFFDAAGKPGSGRLAAVDNCILLLQLLREHILAGNLQ